VHPHILYPYYRGNKKEVLEASSLKVFEDKKQAITSLHQSTEKKVKKLKSPQFNPIQTVVSTTNIKMTVKLSDKSNIMNSKTKSNSTSNSNSTTSSSSSNHSKKRNGKPHGIPKKAIPSKSKIEHRDSSPDYRTSDTIDIDCVNIAAATAGASGTRINSNNDDRRTLKEEGPVSKSKNSQPLKIIPDDSKSRPSGRTTNNNNNNNNKNQYAAAVAPSSNPHATQGGGNKRNGSQGRRIGKKEHDSLTLTHTLEDQAPPLITRVGIDSISSSKSNSNSNISDDKVDKVDTVVVGIAEDSIPNATTNDKENDTDYNDSQPAATTTTKSKGTLPKRQYRGKCFKPRHVKHANSNTNNTNTNTNNTPAIATVQEEVVHNAPDTVAISIGIAITDTDAEEIESIEQVKSNAAGLALLHRISRATSESSSSEENSISTNYAYGNSNANANADATVEDYFDSMEVNRSSSSAIERSNSFFTEELSTDFGVGVGVDGDVDGGGTVDVENQMNTQGVANEENEDSREMKDGHGNDNDNGNLVPNSNIYPNANMNMNMNGYYPPQPMMQQPCFMMPPTPNSATGATGATGTAENTASGDYMYTYPPPEYYTYEYGQQQPAPYMYGPVPYDQQYMTTGSTSPVTTTAATTQPYGYPYPMQMPFDDRYPYANDLDDFNHHHQQQQQAQQQQQQQAQVGIPNIPMMHVPQVPLRYEQATIGGTVFFNPIYVESEGEGKGNDRENEKDQNGKGRAANAVKKGCTPKKKNARKNKKKNKNKKPQDQKGANEHGSRGGRAKGGAKGEGAATKDGCRLSVEFCKGL
jgi:hypothetical protein